MAEPITKADSSPNHMQKAVLWGRENLLVQSVEHFLQESKGWEVVRVSDDGYVESLFEAAKRIDPDVVILCMEKASENPLLPLKLINEQLCSKVVTVELDSNLTQVYSKHNVILQGVSDLLSIVETGNFSDCTHEKEVPGGKAI